MHSQLREEKEEEKQDLNFCTVIYIKTIIKRNVDVADRMPPFFSSAYVALTCPNQTGLLK